jgi:hypothetical protein
MTLTKAAGSFFSQGLRAGATNLKSLFSAKKEILLIEEEIEQASTLLLRQANSFVSYLSDLVEVRLLDKHDAFRMLVRIFNVDPEKQDQRLKFDVMTDKYLVGSPLESHTDHLTIDGYYTRVLTLREEPSESRPLIDFSSSVLLSLAAFEILEDELHDSLRQHWDWNSLLFHNRHIGFQGGQLIRLAFSLARIFEKSRFAEITSEGAGPSTSRSHRR